jgi:hypothetical protein
MDMPPGVEKKKNAETSLVRRKRARELISA